MSVSGNHRSVNSYNPTNHFHTTETDEQELQTSQRIQEIGAAHQTSLQEMASTLPLPIANIVLRYRRRVPKCPSPPTPKDQCYACTPVGGAYDPCPDSE